MLRVGIKRIINYRPIRRDILQLRASSLELRPQTFVHRDVFRGLTTTTRVSNLVADIPSEQPQVNNDEKRRVNLSGLERSFSKFEQRCQINEMVEEKDYISISDIFRECVTFLETKGLIGGSNKGNLALLASTLLRCCGKIMSDVSHQSREQHLANMWQFIKDGPIELDISIYNSLIRSMNENGTQFDPEIMLKEIEEKGLNPDAVTYQRLIHQYCLRGDIANATKILEKMKELGFTLNENIFASLMIGYSHQDKPPACSEIFELMRSSGIEPASKSMATAIQTVAKRFDSPTSEEELKNLLTQSITDDIQFSTEDAVDIIGSLGNIKDNAVAKEIINTLVQSNGYQTTNKRLLRALLNSGLEEQASKCYWSRKPSEKSLATGYVGSFYIKLLASTNRPVDFCLRECEKLISHGYQPRAYHSLFFNAAQVGNMQLVRVAINKISEESKINYTMYWPLIAQAKNEEDIVHVLRNDLNPDMRPSDLVETFADWVWPRFSENYDRLFELNKDLKYKNAILISSFLQYAVRERRINEAIDILTKKVSTLHDTETQAGSPDNENVEVYNDDLVNDRASGRKSIVGVMLNQIAEQTKDPDVVRRASEVCLMPGQSMDQSLAMPLIKAYLLKDDFKGAVETFLELASRYRIAPRKGELIRYCLEKKEPEYLQKIIDALTSISSQSDALFDLAYCCVSVKKLKQAQKILASPGVRIPAQRLYAACRSLQNKNRIDALEDMVSLSLNAYGVDQEYLYSLLIDGYSHNKDGKKVLALYNKMQEDEFQPSKTILLKLAGVLEECGVDVPFQKPTLSKNKDSPQSAQQDRQRRGLDSRF